MDQSIKTCVANEESNDLKYIRLLTLSGCDIAQPGLQDSLSGNILPPRPVIRDQKFVSSISSPRISVTSIVSRNSRPEIRVQKFVVYDISKSRVARGEL